MRRRATSARGGSAMLETALWAPLLILFMMGTVELGRVYYTYHTIQKALYNVARLLGTQQGINFCDTTDTVYSNALAFALTGTSDSTADPLIPGLTADMINVRLERYVPETATLTECTCTLEANGCDAGQGGLAPQYIVVSIPDGYSIQLRIPTLVNDPILLRPQVRVPFGGT
jgi:uncharacterized membrane protein